MEPDAASASPESAVERGRVHGEGAAREPQAIVADMAAVIERMAGDLGLAEEPARFVAALEGEGDPPPPAGEGSRG